MLRSRLQEWAATTIRAAWGGMLDRRTVKRMKNIKSEFDLRESKALDIQRVYQGHLGRILASQKPPKIAPRSPQEHPKRLPDWPKRVSDGPNRATKMSGACVGRINL